MAEWWDSTYLYGAPSPFETGGEAYSNTEDSAAWQVMPDVSEYGGPIAQPTAPPEPAPQPLALPEPATYGAPPEAAVATMPPEPLPQPEPLDFSTYDEEYTDWQRVIEPEPEPQPTLPTEGSDFAVWAEAQQTDVPMPGETQEASEFLALKSVPAMKYIRPRKADVVDTEPPQPQDEWQQGLTAYLQASPAERKAEWDKLFRSEQGPQYLGDLNPDMVIYDEQGNPVDYLDYSEPESGKSLTELLAAQDKAQAELDLAQTRLTTALEEGEDDLKIEELKTALSIAESNKTIADEHVSSVGTADADAKPKMGREQLAASIEATRTLRDAQVSRARFLEANAGVRADAAYEKQFAAVEAAVQKAEVEMNAATAAASTARTQQQYNTAVARYQRAQIAREAAIRNREVLDMSAPARMAGDVTQTKLQAAELRKAAEVNTRKLDQLMKDYKAVSRLDPLNSFLQSTQWLRDAATQHAEDEQAQRAFVSVITEQLQPGLAQQLEPAGQGVPLGPRATVVVDVPFEYENMGERTAGNIMASALPIVGGMVNAQRMGKRSVTAEMPNTLDPRPADIAFHAAAERTAKWVERYGVPVQKWTAEQRKMAVDSMRQEIIADPKVQTAWDYLQQRAAAVVLDQTSKAYDAELVGNIGELTGITKFPVQLAGTALVLLDKAATAIDDENGTPEVLTSFVNAYNAAELRTAAAEQREPILKTLDDFRADDHFLAGVGRSLQNWSATDAWANSWLVSARTAAQMKAVTPEQIASQKAGEEFGAVMGSMALTPAAAGMLLKAAGFGRLVGAAKGLSYAERLGVGVTEATAFSAIEGARTGSSEVAVQNEMMAVPLVVGLGALGEIARRANLASLVQTASGRVVAGARAVGRAGAALANDSWAKDFAARVASEEAAIDLTRIRAAFTRISENAIPPGPVTEANLTKAVAGMNDEVLEAVANITGTLTKTPKGKARDIAWLRKDIVRNALGDEALSQRIVATYNAVLAGSGLQEARAALNGSPVLKHKWLQDPALEPWEREAFIATQNAAADIYANTDVRGVAKAYDTFIHYLAPLARAIENKARNQYGQAIPTAKMVTRGYQDAATYTNTRVAVYRQGLTEALVDTGLVNRVGGFDLAAMKRVAKAIETKDFSALNPAEATAAKRLIKLNREMFADTAAHGVGVKEETGIRETRMDPERYVPMRPLPEVYKDIKAGGKRAAARVDELMATLRDANGNPRLVGEAGRAKAEAIFADMKRAPSIADWANDPRGGGLFAREFGAWPEQMRDWNLPRVFSRHAEYVGREVGMAKAFGADRQKLKDLLDVTQKAMTPEAGVVWRQFVDDYLIGPMEGRVKGYNRGESLFGQISEAEYLAKIGLNPHVTLAQLVQPWIASVGAVGLKRTTAAALQTVYNALFKSGDWALLKTSGVVTKSIMDLAADMSYQVPGASLHNIWARTKYAIGRPFQAGDAWARYVAGTAGHGKAQDAIRFLRGDYSFFERAYRQVYGDTPLFNTSKAQAQVRDWLKRWVGLKDGEIESIVKRTGPNGKWSGFTPDESRRIIGRFVEQTNFRGDILSLPFWARSSPLAKLVTMFGSFGYQQSILAGKSIAEGFRKGPVGALPSLVGTAVGLYAAGDYMTRVEHMLSGKDEQEQTLAANMINRFVASSFAGMLGDMGNKIKHGFTFPVASDLLALKDSLAGAFDATYEGDSLSTVTWKLLNAHIPLVRHSKGLADIGAWAYEKATGDETERLDARAYADALALYSHTRAVQRAADPISAVVADLSDNRVGTGELYRAFAERNRSRLREYLDKKLQEKRGDSRRLSESLATSMAAASPVLRLLQMNAQDAVDLERRTPGLREKQGRAVRHYLNYVSWVRDETLLWAHDNAATLGWNPAKITQPGGPLQIHVGPVSRSDFANSQFFQTAPKTWLALNGADTPDSWVVPMNNAQYKGPITEQLMDEIQALDAWEQYIPPAAIHKMFRLPQTQKYRQAIRPVESLGVDKES